MRAAVEKFDRRNRPGRGRRGSNWSGPMKKDLSTDTTPDLPALPRGAADFPPLSVDVGARTHPGLVRPNNEDNFHVVRFGRYLRTVLTSLPDGLAPAEDARPGYGFVVADGVGGHAAGDVASRSA